MDSRQKLKTRYQVGDLLSVKVIEQIDSRYWIVSLQGVLIQVYNSTTEPLKEGQMITMRLVSLDPPQLSWK